jgi:hypothetical protein
VIDIPSFEQQNIEVLGQRFIVLLGLQPVEEARRWEPALS